MRKKHPKSTNWYVITGGPSVGKSKTIERLAFLGHVIRPEAARIFIDNELSKGRSLSDIRRDEVAFQRKILELDLEVEGRTSAKHPIFWERAIPDSIVYTEAAGDDSTPAITASQLHRYKKVFILDPLPHYSTDYARVETHEEAQRLHKALGECYTQLGYSPIRVPVRSVEDRVQFILQHCKKKG